MKKKLAVILAVISVCTFVSCGDKEEKSSSSSESSSSVSESSAEESSEEEDSEEESSEEESSEEDSSSASEGSEEESSEGESELSDDGFVMGTVEDGVYKSSFNELQFTAPEGFVFATEEEILAAMNIGAEVIGGEKGELYKQLAQQSTIYDMMAQNDETGDNIMVMYENLNAYGEGIADLYDVDMYVEAIESQFAALESSGITYNQKEKATVNIGGKDYTKVDFECEYTDYGINTTQAYYITKNGNYMVAIIASAGMNSEMAPADFEQYFSSYTEE